MVESQKGVGNTLQHMIMTVYVILLLAAAAVVIVWYWRKDIMSFSDKKLSLVIV